MLSFLDALENGLHPQGCLEPPLWFLRQQQINSIPRTTSISSTLKYVDTTPEAKNDNQTIKFD